MVRPHPHRGLPPPGGIPPPGWMPTEDPAYVTVPEIVKPVTGEPAVKVPPVMVPSITVPLELPPVGSGSSSLGDRIKPEY